MILLMPGVMKELPVAVGMIDRGLVYQLFRFSYLSPLMKRLARLVEIFVIIIFILIIFNFRLVSYGLSQLHGQMHIVLQAKPVEEVLADATVADSVKAK